jgi:hypothetical protein
MNIKELCGQHTTIIFGAVIVAGIAIVVAIICMKGAFMMNPNEFTLNHYEQTARLLGLKYVP